MNVFIETLGCKLNFSESSYLQTQFRKKGYKISENKNNNCDILVINSCSVTENADKKCDKFITSFKKKNPNSKVVLIGCYAELKKQELEKKPDINLVVGGIDKFKVIDLLEEKINPSKESLKKTREFVPSHSFEGRTRAFLKVQDGCNYFCSFCTIPLARGRSRSDSIEGVIKRSKELINKGIKEIVLTGINLGDFSTKNNEKLIDLLYRLENIDNLERIRLSSIEPNLFSEKLISFCSTSKKILPHFHIPLQSGSDKVLQEMRRKYDTHLYKKTIESIHSKFNNCAIGADVITGYNNETKEDFNKTIDFIEKLPVTYLHVFPYSERDNTVGVKKHNKNNINIRKQRAKTLREISNKKKLDFYSSNINTIHKVLFEKGKKTNEYNGLTENYIKVKVKFDKNITNNIVNVKLKKITSDNNYILGEVII